MSLIDKQMFMRDLEKRLGSFLPASEIHRIMIETDAALIDYDVESSPSEESDSDSEDLLQYFLDAKRVEGKSDKTVKRYQYILTRLLTDTRVPFSKMTVYHIRKYYEAERQRGIASSTLEGYRNIYSSFFGWLCREGLISQNPMNNLTAIKQPKIVRKPFSAVDIAKMDEAAETTRDRALIAFLLSTGCRVSEVCSVNRDQINWQELCLTVRGKGDKDRTVYIDDVTAMLLQRYLEERQDDDPALFCGLNSCRLAANGIRAMLKRIEKLSGVENVHPHRFRRTLATSLIDKGMPIQMVATILGHEQIDTTMRYVFIQERNVANDYRKYA